MAKLGAGFAGSIAERAGGTVKTSSVSEDEISDIRNPGKSVGKYEYRIALMQTVGEQAERTSQAQPPKQRGHNDPAASFAGPPLHEKPGKEDGVSCPPHAFPEIPFDPEEFALEPKQICEPVHSRPVKPEGEAPDNEIRLFFVHWPEKEESRTPFERVDLFSPQGYGKISSCFPP